MGKLNAGDVGGFLSKLFHKFTKPVFSMAGFSRDEVVYGAVQEGDQKQENIVFLFEETYKHAATLRDEDLRKEMEYQLSVYSKGDIDITVNDLLEYRKSLTDDDNEELLVLRADHREMINDAFAQKHIIA